MQTPAWQAPPVQLVPSGFAGFEHTPVSAPHAPASWHSSDGEQLIGLPPVHFWLTQVDVPLQAVASLHTVPFGCPVHCPHGMVIRAVKQPPGMKQWPALPLKKNSLLAAHLALNDQRANGSRKVAWPLALVVLLPAVIPSTEVGVTALPDTGAPAPSTTVTTDGWLTRMVAVAQPGCVQLYVSLL